MGYYIFFSQIGKSVNDTVSTVLSFLIDAFDLPLLPASCISQALSLMTLLCHNPHTSRVLVTLPLMKKLVTHHDSIQLASFSTPTTCRFRSVFYSALTEVLLLNAVPGDLEHFCAPFNSRIQSLLNAPVNEENKKILTLLLRDVIGVFRSCNSAYHYTTVMELLWGYLGALIRRGPNSLQAIQRYLPVFWNDASFSVSSFRFLIEISSSYSAVVTCRQDRKQRVDTDDSSPRIVVVFKEIASIIVAYLNLAGTAYPVGGATV